LRTRKIDDVISELLYLKQTYPVQIFYFADEMILFDLSHVTELFERVKKEVQIPYGCMARVERISEEVVDLFRRTDCRYVGMGVECGNEEFRKNFLNRHMSNEQIVNAFKVLKTIPGLKTSSYNMKGYPVKYDDKLTQDTLELNKILNPDFVGISFFFPFPGTKLYEYCVVNDLIDYTKMAQVTEYYSESVLKKIRD